ncbi:MULTISPECIES: Cof-type HAD-IIB family hydrolase [Anaerostipes]|uniref:Cof-type HAD-IIB family hydrolase n=1 Tax=Anaerostipes TaxID=207244 RepID=UPI00258BE7EA|nr:Cof-type HAD-IIB family hydrolase [Anaerostipes sp.]MCI5622304.1 Cof-type HAD-IIB family hydrolase [Anaerostipes sp.]
MIELIVSDLDDTLLNNQKQISPRTVSALKQLQKAGIGFLLNTEREYDDVKPILDAADIQCDMICSGGSCFFNQTGKQNKASYIPAETLPPLLRLFGKNRIFYEIYSTRGRCILASKQAYETYLTGEKIPGLLMETKDFEITQEQYDTLIEETLFYDNGELLLKENPEIVKVVSHSNDIWKLRHLKQDLEISFPDLAIIGESPYHIEVNHTDALKGIALQKYIKQQKLSLKDTLVIGNGENDYSMLALPYVKSVAMGNAVPIIKDICEYSTKNNTEDGVAVVLEHVISSI